MTAESVAIDAPDVRSPPKQFAGVVPFILMLMSSRSTNPTLYSHIGSQPSFTSTTRMILPSGVLDIAYGNSIYVAIGVNVVPAIYISSDS